MKYAFIWLSHFYHLDMSERTKSRCSLRDFRITLFRLTPGNTKGNPRRGFHQTHQPTRISERNLWLRSWYNVTQLYSNFFSSRLDFWFVKEWWRMRGVAVWFGGWLIGCLPKIRTDMIERVSRSRVNNHWCTFNRSVLSLHTLSVRVPWCTEYHITSLVPEWETLHWYFGCSL